MTQETELPALPEQTLLCRFMPGDYRYGDVHGFTADQMRAYATAAVLAERERLLALANSRADHEGRLMRHAAMLDLIDAVFGARPSAVKEG